MCCILTEQSALDLVACTILGFGSTVLAETLWISTSSCSLLRRLNCCWTLLWLLPSCQKVSLSCIFFCNPPPQQGPCTVILHVIIRFMIMERADETKLATFWGASSGHYGVCVFDPEEETWLTTLAFYFLALIFCVFFPSHWCKTLLNCLMKCFIFHKLPFFRVSLKVWKWSDCFARMRNTHNINFRLKKSRKLMTW